MSESKIRWGILATGNIAAQFAQDLQQSHSGTLAGAASRDAAKAEAFAPPMVAHPPTMKHC